MSPLPFKRSLALLCVLLSACAATTSAVPEDIEAPDAVYSWEEARADPSCVVPLCDQQRCAIWRCQDAVEAHPVLLAQVTIPAPEVELEPMLPTPMEGSPSRW